MIKYYEDVLEVLRDSVDSIDETTYERLVQQCVETIRNGGKIVASGKSTLLRSMAAWAKMCRSAKSSSER